MADIAETELDVRTLAQTLWRRAWLLALLAIAAAIATYVGLGRVDPLYTADTSVIIEQRESPLTRPREQGASQATEFDEAAILSQVEILRSREIAEAVIDKLDMTRRPEFDPASRPSFVQSLKVMLGMAEAPTTASIRQRVMQSYLERLSVYPLQRSRVISVAFSARRPELAVEVANAVAEAFVTLQQGAKRDSALAATSWLQQEIERLRGRVADSERKVADYRTGNSLYDLGGSGAGGDITNLSTQQLSDINAELARARAARAEAEARAELIQNLLDDGGSIEASEEVLNSTLIQRLRERQVALQSQLAELSTTLLPGHPRIRSLNGQLRQLAGQIRDEAGKVLASLNTAARVAAARENSLRASLDSAKGDVSRSNEQGIELRSLEREATAQRELLESFLARYREAVARTDADYLPADARVISKAEAPREPSYPKKGMMALAAGLATLLLAATVLLIREFTSGRAFRILGTAAAGPSMGLVPALAPPRNNEAAGITATPVIAAASVAVLDDNDATAESLAIDGDRPGTAQIAEIMASDAVRIVLFAGAEGGERAGDVALAAARRAASDKLRVVLIDVGKTASQALGGGERPGLGELLAGDASFGEVIRRDEGSRVHTIPLGSVGEDAPMQRLQLAVAALTHTYDKVIIAADSLADWPDAYIKPDLAAIICEPDMTEKRRGEVYESALSRGAVNALIVRYAHDGESDELEASRAA